MATINFRCSSENLSGARLLQQLSGRRERIDVDHTDDAVAALHGHADRFPHAQLDDAGCRIPAIVFARVTGQHAFLVLADVIEDRPADRHSFGGRTAVPIAAHFGREFIGVIDLPA